MVDAVGDTVCDPAAMPFALGPFTGTPFSEHPFCAFEQLHESTELWGTTIDEGLAVKVHVGGTVFTVNVMLPGASPAESVEVAVYVPGV